MLLAKADDNASMLHLSHRRNVHRRLLERPFHVSDLDAYLLYFHHEYFNSEERQSIIADSHGTAETSLYHKTGLEFERNEFETHSAKGVLLLIPWLLAKGGPRVWVKQSPQRHQDVCW